jgi:multicomponent Na+:H+ antiporter subunit A
VALPLAGFLALIAGLVAHPLPWAWSWPWVPSLGVDLAFRVDGLSAQFLALITGVGTLVFVYASGYFQGDLRRARLLALLAGFMVAMVGAVSADHLLVLFVFWELTSVLSFLLVGFNHGDAEARASARRALLVTVGGGLFLLGGVILLAEVAGSYSLEAILARGPALAEDPRLVPAIGLVLVGCFAKSAQFPFHFWLPDAMAAPTPVSAYLHSATMVKLGVYLMARLDPAFNDLILWEAVLIGVGTLTAVLGAVLTVRERDLKRILAWSTVAALGTLTLLVGLPNPGAGLAVAAFLFAHALYKAPLFFVAGNIDHATGTRVIDHLMGLGRRLPWTAAAAVLAGLSMAGLPLSFGFVAKDAVTAAKAGAELLAVVGYASILVNGIAVAVAAVATVRVFGGPLEAGLGPVHEVGWRMRLPPLVVAALGLLFGLFPATVDPLLGAAAQAIAPALGGIEVSASYEPGPVLTALAIALAIGVAVFLAWDWLHARMLPPARALERVGPAAAYDRLLHGLPQVAAWLTRRLQHGRLGGYLRLTLAGVLALGAAAYALTGTPGPRLALDWPPQAWAYLLPVALILTGAVATALLRARLAILLASGLVGYGSAVLFLFAGAPDLAFTQFAVETVLVVVVAALLPRLGGAAPVRREPWRLNAAIALASGVGVAVLLLATLAGPFDPVVSEFFARASVPEAHGRNVVNVILVDFRAFDTLGEIAVVVFAFLAAVPLLAALRARDAIGPSPPSGRGGTGAGDPGPASGGADRLPAREGTPLEASARGRGGAP